MGSAGQYLKAFSDRVQDVPSFLKRHLALIRDLDEKVVALQSEIDAQSKRKLATGALKSPGSKRQRTDGLHQYDMDSATTRLLSLADEKVTIAAQVYDFIDKHIKDLDSDLAALAQEIDGDKAQLELKEEETACGRVGVELKRGPRARVAKGGAAAAAAADGEAPTKGRRKSKKKEEEALLAHAPGEHEPLYCFCQQPSKGDMIACDNDECQYEWFHYECVGLKEAPPAGEPWYCPYCAPAKNAEKH